MVALDGSIDLRGLVGRRRLAVAPAALILGAALLSACQPIPQSYYDSLAAGDGYSDGYPPQFHGRFVNECRPRDAATCPIDSGRVGSMESADTSPG